MRWRTLLVVAAALVATSGCSEVREIIEDNPEPTLPSDQLLYADFSDGADPFQVADRPTFTATTGDGRYTLEIRGVARSFAPLSRSSPDATIVVDIASFSGLGADEALLGVGCADGSGHGYFVVIDTEEGLAATFDSETGIEPLVIDASFALPSPGSPQQLALACRGNAANGETSIAAAVNGVEVLRETHMDGLYEFSTIGLVFNAGEEPWEIAIDLVDAHLGRPDDPITIND